MRPFKCAIREEVSRQWAEAVAAGTDPRGLLKSKPAMKVSLQDLVTSTCASLASRVELQQKAWRHLRLPETRAAWEENLEEAFKTHADGLLFPASHMDDQQQTDDRQEPDPQEALGAGELPQQLSDDEGEEPEHAADNPEPLVSEASIPELQEYTAEPVEQASASTAPAPARITEGHRAARRGKHASWL